MNVDCIAIVGPTGSGKTALALELAERIGTDIVNCDSMQFYRGMEIGTAAPTPEEQARVRHHFVGFLNPDEQMAAGPYQEQARAVIAAMNAAGKPAVVAGGSGLYISALIDGLFNGPGKDPELRRRLKAEAAEKGNPALMQRLRAVDPAYAATLSSENDLIRIVRALEVYELSGKTFTELHQEHQAALQPLNARLFGIQWPRDLLYERINRRVDLMIAQGWVEEVQALLDHGYGPQLDRLKALGYREIAAALRGEQSLDAAIEATKMHHRRYAKRQLSWFRANPRIHWLNPLANTSAPELANALLGQVNA